MNFFPLTNIYQRGLRVFSYEGNKAACSFLAHFPILPKLLFLMYIRVLLILFIIYILDIDVNLSLYGKAHSTVSYISEKRISSSHFVLYHGLPFVISKTD